MVCAQGKNRNDIPGICLINFKNGNTKIFHLGSKVKYWLHNSQIGYKGRILGVKDSSVIIKGKEIELADISKIAPRNGLKGPLIIASIITIPIYIFPLFITAAILNDRGYNTRGNWKFVKSIKCGIDTVKIESQQKKEKLQTADSSTSISLSINPLNFTVKQYELEIGLQTKNKYYFGIGGGIIKSYKPWYKGYDGTDDYYPTAVYNGWLMSLDYKRLNLTRNHWYFEANFFYKYLYYDHVKFVDGWGDEDPDVEWTRSEVANVYGIKFLMGKKLFLTKHILFESIFGISFRDRHRSFLTLWYNHESDHLTDYQWGVLYHRDQIFPGIQAGLLLTIGNFKIK